MLACAYEAEAALPLVQPAGPGTDIALHAAVVETVPVLGRDRVADVLDQKRVDSVIPTFKRGGRSEVIGRHGSERACGTRRGRGALLNDKSD